MNLTPDPVNPNTMSAEDKARMARSLAEFGDLSGIIKNTTTGLLVSGHQRTSVLTDGKIVAKQLAKPEPDGTTARGHILHLGRQYSYREVAWTPEKAHAALLAANRFGRVGQDDAAALKDILQELDTGEMDMDLTGYTAEAIEQLTTQFHVDEVDAPDIADGDHAPFRQATFTIHDEQWEEIDAAIRKAKSEGGGESAVNENSNGNALAWICGRFNRDD